MSRRWIAMDVDLVTNPIVGMAAKAMKPADPGRARVTWKPMEAWFWMIAEAAHREFSLQVMNTIVMLQRGQLALAERRLADKANWGRRSAINFLDRLEAHGMIQRATPIESIRAQKGQLPLNLDDKKTCHPLTIVTLCNYEKYQTAPKSKGARRVPGGVQSLPLPLPESPLATVETHISVGASQQSGLAGLNGAADVMLTDIIRWMVGGDEQCARAWLGKQVTIYGQQAVRDSYAKLSTDLASGVIVSRPLQAWSKIASRMQAEPSAEVRQGPPRRGALSPQAQAWLDQLEPAEAAQ